MLKSCSRISSIKTRCCLLQALVLPFFPCPHSPDPAALGSGAPLGTCPHQGGLSGSHLLLVTSSRDKAEAGRVWLTAPQGQMPQPTGRETGKGQPHETGHPPGWGGRDPDSAGPQRGRDPGQADGSSSLRPILNTDNSDPQLSYTALGLSSGAPTLSPTF